MSIATITEEFSYVGDLNAALDRLCMTFKVSVSVVNDPGPAANTATIRITGPVRQLILALREKFDLDDSEIVTELYWSE